MKIAFLYTLSLLATGSLFAQSVGINNPVPDSSAVLDVKSDTKGMLLPRTSTASRLAIINPAKGLALYDTTTNSFWFYDSLVWNEIIPGHRLWNLSGNAGTAPSENFIGTTDEQPLRFRINSINAGTLDSSNQSTAFGFRTLDLAAATPSQFNAAFGYKALEKNGSGTHNVALGANALSNNTTGIYNNATGSGALFSNSTGGGNLASGHQALYSNTTGVLNTAIGTRALYNNIAAHLNTATGAYALYSNDSGEYNTANGYHSLYNNGTGSSNTAIGAQSLFYNSTGSVNTAIGRSALYNNRFGIGNTASGSSALAYNTNGHNNTANGQGALYTNTDGGLNTATGALALYSNTTGGLNVANGYQSLYYNTTGGWNTAIGSYSLMNTSGSQNTAIGNEALYYLVAGSKNIAIGFGAGNHINSPNVTNTISIGNDGILNGANNQAFLGNFSTIWNGGNKPWSTYSDARIKTNISEEVKGLEFILRLRPVTYYRSIKEAFNITGNKEPEDFPGKYDVEKIIESGFLAQEVAEAAEKSGYKFSGITIPKNAQELYTLSYEQFVVPLVKALQEQQLIITNQQKQIDGLEKRLLALETKQ